MTEDEMAGWHHRLYGHEFEQALGVGDGQGGLACCGPWGHKESDTMSNLKNNKMISVCFQGKPFNITVIQVYAPTSNAEEAERFYEDLQNLLELTLKKDVLFIIGDWNAKVGSQEIPGVTGKFVLAVQNEAGQRLIEFCQENVLVTANTLFQQRKRRLYTWTSPDAQH